MMVYIVHIYYSKHEFSDVEHVEMSYNYGYGKGMHAQMKPLPPIPPPKKTR